MSFSLLSHTQVGGQSGGTTSAIDSTGANLIVIHLGHGGTPSDSQLNTWGQIISDVEALYYSLNPSTSSAHTFTVTGTDIYSVLGVCCFSGAKSSSAMDQSNNTAGGAPDTSISTGSITPTEDNELLIAGVNYGTATGGLTVGSGFTITDFADLNTLPGGNFSSGMAYKIQTSAGAENPTFSWGTSDFARAMIASFKVAPSGGGPLMFGGSLRRGSLIRGGRLAA